MQTQRVALLLLVVSTLSSANFAQATNFWKNSVLTGNWSTGNNWSATSAAGVDNADVPTSEAVYIAFTDGAARTVTYDVAAPSIGVLSIDLTGPGVTTATLSLPGANNLTTDGIIVGGSNSVALTNGRGALIQSGGTVTTSPTVGDVVVGYGAGSTGVYNLSGGSLINNLHEYIGLAGAGTFNQSAGSNSINASASGFLSVGHNAGVTGTYNLSGTGVLSAATPEYIGYGGAGTFSQTGGTNAMFGSGGLYLGYNATGVGTYNLEGGTLSSEWDLNVGYSGTGYFNQSGGTHRPGANLILGSQSQQASGTFTLSGGTLDIYSGDIIGRKGSGTFIHTGGFHTNDGFFSMGQDAGSTGNYLLSGTGVLSLHNFEYIGISGTAHFTQTGGINAISSFYGITIAVNPRSVGSYTLTGGATTVGGSVYVGGSTVTPGGAGTFDVGGTGELTIGNTLKIYNTVGTAVTLASGGRINAAALNFGGVPSLLNWTGGTLNLTTSVVFDSQAAATTTSAAFGPELTLGADRTLLVAGNETLGGGGAFALTLASGSSHHVSGALTVASTGSITQNAGGSLYAASITQAGGTVNGTLQNQGAFVYQSGQFNGRLLNRGTVSFDASFTAGNGVENDAAITVIAGQTLIVNGAGLDNLGTFTLAGGAISGSGPVLNNYGGTLAGHGTINSALTNNGVLEVDGVLRLNGASNANNGVVRGSGTVIGAFANAAGGTLAVGSGELLAISNAWTNSGLTTLAGSGVLGGGGIANTGTIQGAGTINSPIANSGVIRAAGGELDLGAAGVTNATGGLIQAATGSTVMALQGLAANAGTIALTGGAFDNNNHPLTNTGVINGYGVVRTSALTNANKLNVGEGNLDVFGAVTNNGTIGVQGGRSIYFFGAVNGTGSYTGTGTAMFLAAVSPGNSPAEVSFAGSAVLTSSSTLLVELGGTTRGSEYDAILAAGNLTLGGALAVSLIDVGAGLFAPEAGDSFDILDWGSLNGAFASITLPTLSGLQWNTSRLYTEGVLWVVPPYLEADFNENGTVNVADLAFWKSGFGSFGNATHLQGDANGDHDVDGDDFLTWQRQLGGSSTPPPITAVPEPATLVAAVIALAALAPRAGRGSRFSSKHTA